MSRSRKRVWLAKQTVSKRAKAAASRAVRRCPDVGCGGAYRKVFESYDICDWQSVRFTAASVENWRKPYQFQMK